MFRKFFIAKIDRIEVLDVLLSRYSDINYILKLPANRGLKLYVKALEKENDKYNWDIFIHSNHEKPTTFDQWKKQQVEEYKKNRNKVAKTIVVDDARIQEIINKDKSKLKGG